MIFTEQINRSKKTNGTPLAIAVHLFVSTALAAAAAAVGSRAATLSAGNGTAVADSAEPRLDEAADDADESTG